MNIPLEKFAIYLKNKNLKDRTIENYVYYQSKFLDEAFNQETVSSFLSKKENRNTVARGFLVNFKRFLRLHYKDLGISEENKVKIMEVELPSLTGRKKTRLVNPILHTQIPLIEKVLPNEKFKLMLLLSYFCGLRLGELLKIDMYAFNWDEWREDITKMGECRVLGKGDKEGIALVPAFLIVRIARFIKSEEFDLSDARLFVKVKGDVNAKNHGTVWQKTLKKAGIDCGITKIDEKGEILGSTGIHPHKLRHSWGYHLRNDKDMDIREIQEILRHTDISSTQIYTQVSKKKLKEKLSE